MWVQQTVLDICGLSHLLGALNEQLLIARYLPQRTERSCANKIQRRCLTGFSFMVQICIEHFQQEFVNLAGRLKPAADGDAT